MEGYLVERKMTIFQYMNGIATGMRPDCYLVLLMAWRLERCITVVGCNGIWKSHEEKDHNLVLGYLGSCVFQPTEIGWI